MKELSTRAALAQARTIVARETGNDLGAAAAAEIESVLRS